MKRLGIMILLCLLALTGVSFAEVQTAPAPQKIDTGDTAWMLVSTALVMLMTPDWHSSMEAWSEKECPWNHHAELYYTLYCECDMGALGIYTRIWSG